MNNTPYNQLFAVALFSALASCAPPPPATTRVPVSSSFSNKSSSLSGKVLDKVNDYRAQRGKGVLERHSGLDRLAQEHCDFLVKNCGGDGRKISHSGFENRMFAASNDYKMSSIGENVVSSSDHSPQRLVELWASSKSHEQNMRSSWEYTGIATATAPDGMVVSTQIFGIRELNPSLSKRSVGPGF